MTRITFNYTIIEFIPLQKKFKVWMFLFSNCLHHAFHCVTSLVDSEIKVPEPKHTIIFTESITWLDRIIHAVYTMYD